MIGKKLELVPKTRKGKNIINNAGTSLWSIEKETERVLFSSKVGNWAYVVPAKWPSAWKDRHGRWVNIDEDINFSFVDVPNKSD